MTKGFAHVLLVIAFSILIAGGAIHFRFQQLSKPKQTLSWKTYISTDYNFRVDYPAHWKAAVTDMSDAYKSEIFPGRVKQYIVFFNPNSYENSIAQESIIFLPEGEMDTDAPAEKGTAIIAGQEVETRIHQTGEVIYFHPRMKIHAQPRSIITDQMLSTFKFTN